MCHWDPADSALLIFFSGSSAEKKNGYLSGIHVFQYTNIAASINGTYYWLVVWNHGILLTFHSVGNVIIPTDELIFFRAVETTNQL